MGGQKGTFYLSTSGASPFCGHEYFVDIKAADNMYRTYGEFMVTLIGTKGSSEALKLESQMHIYNGGQEERHVIATHTDIGDVTGVKLQYVRARHLFTASYIKVYSVVVHAAETNQVLTFCAHKQRFNAGQTHTINSRS